MVSEKHIFLAGNFYHIYNRGNEGRDIFFERENFLFFLRKLGKYCDQMLIRVVCYCLMPNHFHLLLKQTADMSISKLMAVLCTSYAKAINSRYQRVGHLFQDRYKAKWIGSTEYLVHLSRYFHVNPVIAGLVDKPEDWEFSSYRDFIGMRCGKLPMSELVLNEFGCTEDYREFVLSYVDDSKIKNYILE